jgi:hypothetical protein
MPTTLVTPHHEALTATSSDRDSAACRMAYRRLAAAILGIDVNNLAADLQTRRGGKQPRSQKRERVRGLHELAGARN